jgi:imidazole glycerol-phosphate synthase subunit HisH
MIAIIDYEMGNLGSIRNMLKMLGHDSKITSDLEQIAQADKLILPGVGAFDAGMKNLRRLNLIQVLNERVLVARTPILGICLGMQLMGKSSAEGVLDGLSWVNAVSLRFEPGPLSLKVPHMGWNEAVVVRDAPLTQGLPHGSRFYFVHSYFVRCRVPNSVLLRTFYGENFDSAFQQVNIWGVQFHPEKSHKFGMCILRNFASRC